MSQVNEIRDIVKKKYAKAIQNKSSCCGSSDNCCNPVTGNIYNKADLNSIPEDLIMKSFGCGNPTVLAELHAGETVLDLGSGAGLDVLLSAQRVGAYGKAIGLDMTEEMLAEANANKQRAGITNAEFRQGTIEEIPLPNNSVDVIISNCVINLSGDKDAVLKEAYRVLRSGGRLAVSDIVLTRELSPNIKNSLAAWAGCVSGALSEQEYREKLLLSGFSDLEVVITRTYEFNDENANSFLSEISIEERQSLSGALVSAFIRAKKTPIKLVPGREYSIRFATVEDLPTIHRLLESSGLPLEGIKENLHNFFVANYKGIAGVIGIEFDNSAAMLRSLVIDQQFRKQGIASSLVDHALNFARTNGVKAAFILTNTAEKFAVRWGFAKIERNEIPLSLLNNSELKKACPSSSTCMKLELM